jgi:hypothetical protein
MGSEDLVEGYERPRVLLKLLYLDIATSKVDSGQMGRPKKLEANGMSKTHEVVLEVNSPRICKKELRRPTPYRNQVG